MEIIVDTREQQPWWKCKKTTLCVGDYTTVKLIHLFHVERKSLQDLYSTLVQGNSRFKREVFKSAYLQIKLELYIEGSYDDFINKRFPRGADRKCPTDKLVKLVSTFERVYHLTFNWHASRAQCIKAVQKRLAIEESNFKGPVYLGYQPRKTLKLA